MLKHLEAYDIFFHLDREHKDLFFFYDNNQNKDIRTIKYNDIENFEKEVEKFFNFVT